MTNILTPIEPPFETEMAAILDSYPSQDGYLLKLFRAFANSARFARKAVPNLLDRESPLSLREREIVILRTTANRNCEYEWGVHVAIFAQAAKLSPEQIASTCAAEIELELWNERDALLLRCIDQLCSDGRMTSETLQHFREEWDTGEQLEIVALCGTYHTVSFAANISQIGLEEFGVKFPAV